MSQFDSGRTMFAESALSSIEQMMKGGSLENPQPEEAKQIPLAQQHSSTGS